MNAERVSAKAVLVMGRIASFIASMISVGGCTSAGFAEAGALVPPTPVDGLHLQVMAADSIRSMIKRLSAFSFEFSANTYSTA